MKLWELISIFRWTEDEEALMELLSDERWQHIHAHFLQFEELVARQDRAILDMVLPEELVAQALELIQRPLYMKDGILKSFWVEGSSEITFTQAAEEFGADVLEEVMEKGSLKNHRFP